MKNYATADYDQFYALDAAACLSHKLLLHRFLSATFAAAFVSFQIELCAIQVCISVCA